jgi:hypothetical protein
LLFRPEPELHASSLNLGGSVLGESEIFVVIGSTSKDGDDSIFLINKWAR